jgi:acetyl-CoA C-acetyltransferase
MPPAARAALRRAGLTLGDLDGIEVNEAFAGQLLACCRALGLDSERVCVQAGALALGYPWAASGAVLVVRLLSQLVHRGGEGWLRSRSAGQVVAVVGSSSADGGRGTLEPTGAGTSVGR